MKKHQLYVFIVLPLLAVMTVGLFIASDGRKSASAITPACTEAGSITLNGFTSGANNTVTSGSYTLSFTRTTGVDQIAQVYFTFDDETNFVGRGIKTDFATWSMNWLSYVSPPGPHTIGALVKTPTSTCLAPSITVFVDNPSGMKPLRTTANPSQFTDYTNVSREFILQTSVDRLDNVPYDITPWALYFRGPVSHGVISSDQSSNIIRYFSGATPGTGGFEVKVNYGGTMIPVNVPVNVLPAPIATAQPKEPVAAPTQTGPTLSTPTISQTTTTAPTASATSNSPAVVVDSDPIVKLCLIKAITEPRYLLVNSGGSRPTSKEFELSRQCFADRNYVIPVVYSPVLASKSVVKEFEVTTDARVAKITTSTVKKDSGLKPAIKFSGRAAPNSLVLIYVFSEPLVLSTTSNGDGEWNYSLEDPLEPGKHEAYALVNQGDGIYERSSVFNFAIARASAASSNPTGSSFTVEANSATPVENNYTTKLYVSAVIGLVFIVIIALVIYLVRRQSHANPYLPSAVSAEPKPVYTPPQAFTVPSIITPSVEPSPESSNAENIK